MPEPVVVAESLRKNYGKFTAVDGINFTVQRGECFGTQVVAEGRSVGALVDEPIGCDGDYEAIAELPRLLQVSDVPDVEQVEYTVALHDLGPTCGGFVEFVCDFAK